MLLLKNNTLQGVTFGEKPTDEILNIMRTIALCKFRSVPEGTPPYIYDFLSYQSLEHPPLLLVAWWALCVPKVSTKSRSLHGKVNCIERVQSVHNATLHEAVLTLRYSYRQAQSVGPSGDALRAERQRSLTAWSNLCNYLHQNFGVTLDKKYVPHIVEAAKSDASGEQNAIIANEGKIFIPRAFFDRQCKYVPSLQHRFKDKRERSTDALYTKDNAIVTSFVNKGFDRPINRDRLLDFVRWYFTESERLEYSPSTADFAKLRTKYNTYKTAYHAFT